MNLLLKGIPAWYGVAEQEQVEYIKAWIAEHAEKDPNYSQSWLAKACDMSTSALSQILSYKYPKTPSSQLQKCLQTLAVESERLEDGTAGYTKGGVHALMFAVCDRTRKSASIGVFTGYVGIGKTRTLKEYCVAKPLTIMLEACPRMTASVVLDEIMRKLRLPEQVGLDKKFRLIVRALAKTQYLIAIDEAERLAPSALEYLRRVRDIASVGLVLVGTEKLHDMLSRDHGQFDQIRSRIAMWPKTVECISRDDADNMARAGLAAVSGGEVDDHTLDALWAYCKGSARVLNESLIPAVRDYKPADRALSAALVAAIADKALYMKVPTGYALPKTKASVVASSTSTTAHTSTQEVSA